MKSSIQRNIGPFALMLTGLGSIIGSGWLFGAWKAAKIAGPAAICAWIIGAVVILAIALTYAELGAMFPESGGMVRYARYSHGSLVGFISAWANWIAIVSVIPIEAEASIQYMSTWPYPWGMTEVQGASLLAAMGVFDLFGTTLSGWLSDRYDNRVLLFWYYGLRGLSLIYLPHAFGIDFFGLPLFAMFYGLDWIATVPPTVRLATDVFGKAAAPVVFGWIVAGHQLGAAFAALGAGLLRASLGTYTIASMISGGLCIVGALIVLRINRGPSRAAAQAA